MQVRRVMINRALRVLSHKTFFVVKTDYWHITSDARLLWLLDFSHAVIFIE